LNFTTIILAGGQSSRMGTNKALIPYLGKPLVSYAIELAGMFSNDILLSVNNHDLDALGYRVVNDIVKVRAPLSGIHAGLTCSRTDWNLVLTCDMPNVTAELVNRLLSAIAPGLKLVLPYHQDFIEPLCGFYHRDLLPVIESNVAAGKLSLLDLPGLVAHRFITLDDMKSEEINFLFRNMNEKRDLLN
jgi:molybdopterin-guanine dinucleotide biosynthesis protein A